LRGGGEGGGGGVGVYSQSGLLEGTTLVAGTLTATNGRDLNGSGKASGRGEARVPLEECVWWWGVLSMDDVGFLGSLCL